MIRANTPKSDEISQQLAPKFQLEKGPYWGVRFLNSLRAMCVFTAI